MNPGNCAERPPIIQQTPGTMKQPRDHHPVQQKLQRKRGHSNPEVRSSINAPFPLPDIRRTHATSVSIFRTSTECTSGDRNGGRMRPPFRSSVPRLNALRSWLKDCCALHSFRRRNRVVRQSIYRRGPAKASRGEEPPPIPAVAPTKSRGPPPVRPALRQNSIHHPTKTAFPSTIRVESFRAALQRADPVKVQLPIRVALKLAPATSQCEIGR